MSDPDAPLVRQVSAQPYAAATRGVAPLDIVNGLAVAQFHDQKLAASAATLTADLLADKGQGEVIRRELAAEVACARSRVRGHQLLLDHLLEEALEAGKPSRNVRLLADIVRAEERHYVLVLDLYSRLALGPANITVRAHQAAVLFQQGGTR